MGVRQPRGPQGHLCYVPSACSHPPYKLGCNALGAAISPPRSRLDARSGACRRSCSHHGLVDLMPCTAVAVLYEVLLD